MLFITETVKSEELNNGTRNTTQFTQQAGVSPDAHCRTFVEWYNGKNDWL